MNSRIAPAVEAALLEAFAACNVLLPPGLRRSFVLVGGAALLR